MAKKTKGSETAQNLNNAFSGSKFYVLGGLAIFFLAVFISSFSLKKTRPEKPAATGTSATTQATETPERFTAAEDAIWLQRKGVNYPYVFSFPESLPLVVFINDQDTVAVAWKDLPPQQNILLYVEKLNSKDQKALSAPKADYVRNWYKSFSGLKDVAKVTPFTNASGMKGYKAVYVNQAGQTPNLDVFFEVPQRNDLMIHLANGVIDPVIFDRIIDSVKWEPELKN